MGTWIEVQETAANSGGLNVSRSEAVEVIPPEAPANTLPPAITGTIQQGQTLTVREGTWTNSAKTPVWQWLRCDADRRRLHSDRRRHQEDLQARSPKTWATL